MMDGMIDGVISVIINGESMAISDGNDNDR
jgi:hypothetical protein